MDTIKTETNIDHHTAPAPQLQPWERPTMTRYDAREAEGGVAIVSDDGAAFRS